MGKHTSTSHKVEDIEVTYEDDETRRSYEIAAQVRYFEATLPPDQAELTANYSLIPITFSSADEVEKGEAALFFIGDFLHVSEDESIHYIRPRTKRILDALSVQYDAISTENGKNWG